MVGRKVTKLFVDDDGHDKWYFGTVESYDPAARYFKVRYTDSDEEELDEEQIHQHLANRQRLVSSDDEEEESSDREKDLDGSDATTSTSKTPTASAPTPERGEMEDTTKRTKNKITKPITIKDHPKLPGWKLRTDCNPVLHISPARKIPFRNFKIAFQFAELVTTHGDEYAAFEIIEKEYRNKKRKNGRDLIYSVVAALPRDDHRSRNKPIQPKKALEVQEVKVDDLPLDSIEKILDKRSVGSRIEYLVRFAGLPEEEDAWVPKRKLDSKALRMAKTFDDEALVKKRRKNRGGPEIDFLPSEAAGAGASPLMLNDEPVKVQVMADPGRIEKGCFLDEFAPGRVLMRSYDISDASRAKRYSPKAECQQNGGTYTAVATRIIDQKSSGNQFGLRKKDAYVYYILTKGGGLPDFDLQKELEKVADFSSLPPHKIPARLEVGVICMPLLPTILHHFHLHLTTWPTT